MMAPEVIVSNGMGCGESIQGNRSSDSISVAMVMRLVG